MFSNKLLKKILLKNKIVSEENFKDLEKEAKKSDKKIEDYLIEKKIINTSSLYESAANFLKMPFINLKGQIVRKDTLSLIPEPIANTHKIAAFGQEGKELKIAVSSPENLEILEFIKKKTGLNTKAYLAVPDDIKKTLKEYHKSLKSELDDLDKEAVKESAEDLEKIANELSVVKIVDSILEHAIFEEASDIHIEPEEKNIIIRYRMDGMLNKEMELPKKLQAGISARIKILSNLKVDEHRLPQDGRFKISTEDQKVSFRVSIIPAFSGEKIVMRLLNEKAQVLNLEQLGLQPEGLRAVKRNIAKPNGMILVTGPTGSGKTTTLYTILNLLNKPEVNISTIEDPIEYRMPHINQSQTNSKIGYTFAVGLRAFLRQDPDIIMVGEIRDEETAEIGVHAAMTGHLVLSTLHTNDAPTTIPRLGEMGVPSFLIASTVNLIIAQRLVRKICPHCIQSYNLNKDTIDELNEQFDMKDILSALEKEKTITSSVKDLKNLLFYRGKGCNQCKNSGYKGRIGIYETLEMTPDISELIIKKATPEEINKHIEKKGLISLTKDGFIKAKNGITTIEEILRVTKE